MNTTNLFVELVVIGVGILAALILLVLSIFGYEWVSWNIITSPTILIPLLSVTYLLGIVVDRIADLLFKKWNRDLRLQIFPNNHEYHLARNYVYQFAGEQVIALFLYGRSRLRICRAWSLNCILLAVSLIVFIWTRLSQVSNETRISITIFGTAFFVIGAIANFLTWRKLADNDYKRLFEMNTILKNNQQKQAN